MQVAVSDTELAEGVFQRIGSDLEAILDHELSVGTVTAARRTERPVGEGCVHVSFRFACEVGGANRQGTLLLPLPEAMAMASYLMMASDQIVRESRRLRAPDTATKEAMLEIDNFVACAVDSTLRTWSEDVTTTPGGCQGVRADVPPVLQRADGGEMVVARGLMRLGGFEEFEAILAIPVE